MPESDFGNQAVVGFVVVPASSTQCVPVRYAMRATACRATVTPYGGPPAVRNFQWIVAHGFQRTGLPPTMLSNL